MFITLNINVKYVCMCDEEWHHNLVSILLLLLLSNYGVSAMFSSLLLLQQYYSATVTEELLSQFISSFFLNIFYFCNSLCDDITRVSTRKISLYSSLLVALTSFG
jgi:hypothetical protein